MISVGNSGNYCDADPTGGIVCQCYSGVIRGLAEYAWEATADQLVGGLAYGLFDLDVLSLLALYISIVK